MAITRRQFLQRSGAVTAGALLGPSLFDNLFVRRALASTIGDRYFVVIFLDGGNDGLNTVTPVTNGGGTLRNDYEAARQTGNGGLRLLPGALAGTLVGNDPNTGAQLAIHPGFGDMIAPASGGLKALYDLGKVAVFQGCGYPSYSLSHDQSRTIWRTANPLGLGTLSGTGWMGRYLAQNYAALDIPGVTIDDSVAAEFRQTATSVLAIPRVRNFGFPVDDFAPDDQMAKEAAFDALCTAAGMGLQPTDAYIGNSGHATLISTQSYPGLHSLYVNDPSRKVFNDQYVGTNGLNTSTARNLLEIAKIINGVNQGVPNVDARFFQLANGGYDTHSDQGAAATDGQQYSLHQEVGNALKVFHDDLADMGMIDKVVVMVWSEFSRRINQNDNGTDHGSQGPMFVIGGAVNGGLYGNHPNIAAAALDDDGNTVYSQDANPFRSTDFRDVYGTILKHWLNMPQATILSSVLPLDTGSASDYWTVQNFDLSFLP